MTLLFENKIDVASRRVSLLGVCVAVVSVVMVNIVESLYIFRLSSATSGGALLLDFVLMYLLAILL